MFDAALMWAHTGIFTLDMPDDMSPHIEFLDHSEWCIRHAHCARRISWTLHNKHWQRLRRPRRRWLFVSQPLFHASLTTSMLKFQSSIHPIDRRSPAPTASLLFWCYFVVAKYWRYFLPPPSQVSSLPRKSRGGAIPYQGWSWKGLHNCVV